MKALILFGPHLISFRDSGILKYNYHGSGELKYQRTITSLLIRSENLVESELSFWHLPDEILTMLQPLFGRLQKLVLFACYLNDGSLLNMLPLWCPELRELALIVSSRDEEFLRSDFNGLQVHFPKLTKIVCKDLDGFGKNQLETFLKLHSHLKAFEFSTCEFQENCVIRFITEHVPDIETLDLLLYGRNDCVKYFGQLSKLKSLKLYLVEVSANFTLSIIREISTSNIQLKQLELSLVGANWKRGARRFVSAISKLKKLETLKLIEFNLTALNIIAVCKHLGELSTLKLFIHFTPTAEDITEFIRASPKLQLLKLGPKVDDGGSFHFPEQKNICIDVEIFKKLVAIVEEGCKDRRLCS